MKKLFSILSLTLILGCSPEEPETPKECGCGLVTSRIQLSTQIGNYLYEYKDFCIGKVETFVTWDIYNIGQKYCK